MALYLHLLLTSQQVEVSGDNHAVPTFRNRACGTNGMAECVGGEACVDILEKR